jgi:hypothetical protein
MNVLLIYERAPEPTEFYVIPNVSDEDLAHLDEANGHYLGSDEGNDGVLAVNDYLCKEDEHCRVPGDLMSGQWVKHKTSPSNVLNIMDYSPLDRVYQVY